MTTIAYKAGIIAYDSRGTAGSIIIDDNIDKSKTVDGVKCFYSGDIADVDIFLEAYEKREYQGKADGYAFVIEDGKLYRSLISEEFGFNRLEIDPNKHYSIGGGQDHALTAMDMGATAKEAVKWAMKRDTGTGGRIRTYKLR